MEWDFFALIKTEHKRFLSVLFSFRFFSYISFFPVSFLHECELYGTSRIECVTNNNLSPQCKWEKAIHHHIFVCQTHMYLSLGYVRRGEFSAKHWSFFFCCCEPTVHTLTASRWPNCGAVILPFDRTRMWMGRRSKKWWTKKKLISAMKNINVSPPGSVRKEMPICPFHSTSLVFHVYWFKCALIWLLRIEAMVKNQFLWTGNRSVCFSFNFISNFCIQYRKSEPSTTRSAKLQSCGRETAEKTCSVKLKLNWIR